MEERSYFNFPQCTVLKTGSERSNIRRLPTNNFFLKGLNFINSCSCEQLFTEAWAFKNVLVRKWATRPFLTMAK